MAITGLYGPQWMHGTATLSDLAAIIADLQTALAIVETQGADSAAAIAAESSARTAAIALLSGTYGQKAADETITGEWDFTTAPTVNGAPIGGTVADATAVAKGKLALAGDLAGPGSTADRPIVANKKPKRPSYYLSDYATSDARQVDDVVTTAGSNIITSVKANWTSADVGKSITVGRADTHVATRTTITQFDSESQVRLATTIGNTSGGSPAGASWGTDCGAGLQALLDAAGTAGRGVTAVIDGHYFLRTPVQKNFNILNARVEIMGEGGDGSLIVSDCGGSRALYLINCPTIIVAGITFTGTPWVDADSLVTVELAGCASLGLVDACQFYGVGGVAVRYTNALGVMRASKFGGCGAPTAVDAGVVEHINWYGVDMDEISFLDFAYVTGDVNPHTTAKKAFDSPAWVLVKDPDSLATNALSGFTVDLRRMVMDEAPLSMIRVTPTTRRIPDVRMTDIKINGRNVSVIGAGTAKGITVSKAARTRITEARFPYRSITPTATAIELLDAGYVTLDRVNAQAGTTDAGVPISKMDTITADASTTQLDLIDCTYATLTAACPVSVRTNGVGGVVAGRKASGDVTDADFPSAPPVGFLHISGNDLWMRVGVNSWVRAGYPPAIPGAPGTPVAVGGDTSASLTWTAAANNNSPITSYVVTPYIAGVAQTTTVVGNVLLATVTGLTNGTAYTFKVHAVNAVGAGPQSAASNSVTPAFTPASLTNLAVWLKADALALADGAAVASWDDSSGNARHAVQATGAAQPTMQTAELNGLPIVRFDGVDDLVRTAAFTLPQPVTTFIVCKWAATTNYKAAHDGRTTSTGLIDLEAGTFRLHAGGATVNFGTASTAWRIVNVVWNGASSKGRAEGGAGTTLNPGTAAMGGLTVGAQGVGAGGYANVDVAEVIEYSRVLTTAELNQVGGYLATKYGLTWTTVP